MTSTALSPQRYFELLDADTERLLAVGDLGLDAPIPCCPGWTVADVARHVATVFEHKVRVMADNGWPDPWPPPALAEQPPLEALTDAKTHLFAEFAEHQLAERTTTFSAADSTIGFWARRMALELAVHRYDGELAHGVVTPIDDELALDGIDEVLRVMLAGPWWESRVTTEHPVDAVVAVSSGGRRWSCRLAATQVTVSDDATSAVAATVGGPPMTVFLWLWGRVGDADVTLQGDRAVVAEFRARLVECTG